MSKEKGIETGTGTISRDRELSIMTPGTAAKIWAANNPNEEAIIEVLSYAPKGKGGRRGTMIKETKFFASSGAAERQRGDRETWTNNGQCNLCLKLFLKPTLREAWLPDPEAGAVSGNYMVKEEIAPEAWIIACPSCVEERGLDTNYKKYWDKRPPSGNIYKIRFHPDYELFRGVKTVKIDLTKGGN